MYVSSLVLFPATAHLLGSWLRLFLSPVLMALIILRTALEDPMLRDGLVGYAGCTRALRYRLVPRVWRT
jgi:protein-S-isoprenylcysteine O-methyltransferase Ste14